MRRRNLGMTLLELLVALMLLTAISTALLSATSMGIRTLERAQDAAEYDDGTVTRLQLRRWLRTAASPTLLSPIDTGFGGSSKGVEFTTLLPSGHAPEAAALRLSLDLSNGMVTLRIDELNDQSEIISSLTRKLGDEVDGADIHYLEQRDEGPAWVSEWSSDRQLPLAVKIEAPPGNGSWPLFLVKLAYSRP